ncbi:hypothetical protein F442_22727, partial [Phytophthora nicotianae P10297]
TKFLYLLSQLDCDMPEIVKQWFYQQNIRAETSAFVSQNVPSPLQEVIELTQRIEDARGATSTESKGAKSKKNQSEPQALGRSPAPKRNPGGQASSQKAITWAKGSDTPSCELCHKPGHSEASCLKKKAGAKGEAPRGRRQKNE